MEKEELSLEAFKKEPARSNSILINDRPLESWISAEAGQSKCCDVCGDEECRTVEVEGQVYETIPADLITRAGLVTAAEMVGSKKDESCCSPAPAGKSSSGRCCGK